MSVFKRLNARIFGFLNRGKEVRPQTQQNVAVRMAIEPAKPDIVLGKSFTLKMHPLLPESLKSLTAIVKENNKYAQDPDFIKTKKLAKQWKIVTHDNGESILVYRTTTNSAIIATINAKGELFFHL